MVTMMTTTTAMMMMMMMVMVMVMMIETTKFPFTNSYLLSATYLFRHKASACSGTG
jgi:hypothetical protein